MGTKSWEVGCWSHFKSGPTDLWTQFKRRRGFWSRTKKTPLIPSLHHLHSAPIVDTFHFFLQGHWNDCMRRDVNLSRLLTRIQALQMGVTGKKSLSQTSLAVRDLFSHLGSRLTQCLISSWFQLILGFEINPKAVVPKPFSMRTKWPIGTLLKTRVERNRNVCQ